MSHKAIKSVVCPHATLNKNYFDSGKGSTEPLLFTCTTLLTCVKSLVMVPSPLMVGDELVNASRINKGITA
jgi:hypothetical protein